MVHCGHTQSHHSKPELLSRCLHQILTQHLKAAAEIETHEIRQHFYNLLFCFGESFFKHYPQFPVLS